MLQGRFFSEEDLLRLTSSAAGSRAKTSRRQAKAKASRASGRASGSKCCESLTRYDLLGCSLKMYLLFAAEEATRCSLVWKNSGTPAGRSWWVLGRSVPRTKGTGCRSSENWGTPEAAAIEVGTSRRKNRDRGNRHGESLHHQLVRVTQWPTVHGNNGSNGPTGTELGNAVTKVWRTPQSHEREATPKAGMRGENNPNLAMQATWPTPTKNANRDCPSEATHHTPCLETVVGQADQESLSMAGKPRGSLNAAWVGQLMGWPDEYVAELTKVCCEYWAMAGSHKSQS